MGAGNPTADLWKSDVVTTELSAQRYLVTFGTRLISDGEGGVEYPETTRESHTGRRTPGTLAQRRLRQGWHA